VLIGVWTEEEDLRGETGLNRRWNYMWVSPHQPPPPFEEEG